MHWFKLVNIVAVLAWVAWMYAKNGWRAGYSIGRGAESRVAQGQHALAVREQQTRFGWPVWAMLEKASTRRWHFHLRPQSRGSFRREIELGIPALDAAFWIGPGSQALVRVLLERDAVHRHLLALEPLLVREGSKLSRVAADDGKYWLEVNVRWVRDRPRLYAQLLAWLVEFDRLLSAEVGMGGPGSVPARNGPT